jgi:ADP-ribose pyrophosphatase YjhB (NUDIX family)
MDEDVPAEARPAARVLLMDPFDRLLLLEGIDRSTGHRWWVTPGGGLGPGESFEEAASRELREETGQVLPIGPHVWNRRHVFEWEGRPFDVYERFYVARTTMTEVEPVRRNAYVRSQRWWSVDEIAKSSEGFAPRRLAELISAILRGDPPEPPIDCGV